MIARFAYLVLFVAILIGGFSLRMQNAQTRAIHADESEQASTFAHLLDGNGYKYNPNGPHGGTLYYYALLCDKITRPFVETFPALELEKSNAQTKNIDPEKKSDSTTILFLRYTILAFSALTAIALLLSARQMGMTAALAALACFALSCLTTIYSVYFVQETIFAFAILCFTLTSWRFLNSPNFVNALWLGLSAGLAQATKETSPIAFASAFGAVGVLTLASDELKNKIFGALKLSNLSKSLFGFIAGFALVFVAFYSSFGENPKGVLDAFTSYTHFSEKSQSAEHTQEFLYYAKLLTLQKSSGVKFGEAPITIMFAIGAGVAILGIFKRRKTSKETPQKQEKSEYFALFVALCAIFNLLILSFIPYKTPWLALSPLVLMCIVAGFGFAKIAKIKNISARILLLCGVFSLAWWQFGLDKLATKRFHSDPRSPFIYTHTVTDFKNLIERIRNCSKVSEYKADIPVAFITRNSPWPAPWLLRDLKNVCFWGEKIPQNIKIYQIVVCDATTEKMVSNTLDPKEYISEFFGLRENLPLTVFVQRKLFNDSIQVE